MAQFQVKVRNLETGDMLIAEMRDADECEVWLAERPQFIEIVTVLSDCSPAESQRLKEAMRPYDAEELALKRKYDAKVEHAVRAAYQQEMEAIESEQARAKTASDGDDPNRPIAVKYECDEGLTVVDDTRQLTDVARDACLEWIRERNAWVAPKGQMIGEAHLEVWPNDVPDGAERVLEGGRFFPRLKDA
ncbi:MAG: hypothetical protein AB7S26_08670 [Sandaracinaceae bacterium]